MLFIQFVMFEIFLSPPSTMYQLSKKLKKPIGNIKANKQHNKTSFNSISTIKSIYQYYP